MIAWVLLSALVILVSVVILRTVCFRPKKNDIKDTTVILENAEQAACRLAQAVSFQTISDADQRKMDLTAFEAFHGFLKEAYPIFHQRLESEVINRGSLLYVWRGRCPELKPVLMTAHQDVVPANDESQWEVPPFKGEIRDGYVWGRGTLDTKIQIIAMMEAVEKLLQRDYHPECDIWFAFGHDEEQNGLNGAKKIAEVLKERNIRFEFLLDEGGCITENALAGVAKPIAVIGTCEKGYMNVKLTAKGQPGHASQPPKQTALGSLARAATALERHPMRCELSAPVREMLMQTGPYMSLSNRIIIANLWLFKPLFMAVFSKSNMGNAMLRTTLALTMAEGSEVPNVLPQQASMVMNLRNAPSVSTQAALKHIKRAIDNDEIEIIPMYLLEPSPISKTDARGYRLISKCIEKIDPDAIVSPYLMMAGTDSAKYSDITENTYRFAPYRISAEDLSRIHGNNERISIENISRCIAFYKELFTSLSIYTKQ